MTAFSYDLKQGAWTKECPRCKQVTIGTDDQDESYLIFEKIYGMQILGRGCLDGLQGTCRVCKEKDRVIRNYGEIDIEAMLIAQNGKCAICEDELHLLSRGRGDRQRACVDHNHKTGQVRGLLCRVCNAALGKFLDDVLRLMKAVNYLNRYENNVIPLIQRRL